MSDYQPTARDVAGSLVLAVVLFANALAFCTWPIPGAIVTVVVAFVAPHAWNRWVTR